MALIPAQNLDVVAKFTATYNAGNRILPSPTSKNDADYQMRIDAGEEIDDKRNIVLQVNREAKGTALKEWERKNGSHTKLATATFDTTTKDPAAETDRALAELEEDAKKAI